VNNVLRFCTADCADACEGDQMAFEFCRGGCRNKLCGLLASACQCVKGEDCTVFTTTTGPPTTTMTSTTTTTTF